MRNRTLSKPGKNFSDGAWCMERFHDRPFQDFVAHETHRLIPGSTTIKPVVDDRAGMLSSPARRWSI
jgi:hypothetical protein